MTRKLKKVSAEILELGLKSGEARASPASPLPTALLYEQVGPTNQTITKNDLELQPNPAYGTSHKVIMDTNPAYESCK